MSNLIASGGGITTAFATAMMAGHAFAYSPSVQHVYEAPHSGIASRRIYTFGGRSSTYNQYTSAFTGEFTIRPAVAFNEMLSGFYSNLLAKQTSLDPEFEALLSDNLWDLYAQ